MKKIIFIAPHLSTGGLPQYLFRKITDLSQSLEVHCIEYEDITGGKFVVQRQKIEKFLGSRFYSLGEDKSEIFSIIEKVQPDFIHLEEIPEYFLPRELTVKIYNKDRKYKIFETSHDSSFNPDDRKIFFPDAFFFVSQWQIEQYKNINIPKYLAEYPIDYRDRPDRDEGLRKLGLDPLKKHILNVGLFTPRKNQAEVFELAKRFNNDVQFHFIGNQADNFKFYWEPLMKGKPSNCIVWGERSDTDNFYSCMDAFYFASRGNDGDKETMPLVLKEALGWKIPILLYNLDVYLGYFDKFPNVEYLDSSIEENSKKLSRIIGAHESTIKVKTDNIFEAWYSPSEHMFNIKCLDEMSYAGKTFRVVLLDSENNLTNYSFDLTFNPGFTSWFKSNSSTEHFNGYRIEIYDTQTSKQVYSQKVFEFQRSQPLVPKVKGKKIEIEHDLIDDSSWFTFYEVFLRNDYSGIKKGDVVLDIGANLGFLSLYAVENGASKVYSIEPDPTCFQYLTNNTKGFEEIIPLNYAISDKVGEIDFYKGKLSSIGTIRDTSENIDYSQSDRNKIKVKSLDANSLISTAGIEKVDYLKIDCEGAEFEFFDSIDEHFLSNKISYICGEVHRFAGCQTEYETKIRQKLIRCGFEVVENDSLDLNAIILFKAKRKPKIKVIHLLNSPDQEREKKSIDSLKGLEEFGIRYEQIVTPLYKDVPPRDYCNRPESVSETPGEYLLGPGHYGCYLAHRKGIVEGLDDDVDAILLNECDSILQFSPKQIAEKIYEAYDLALQNNLAYVSFGKKIPGHQHEKLGEEFFTTDRLSEAHCILIPKTKHEYFKSKFESSPWDVSDLWYNVFITEHKKGIFGRPYALQHPGNSNIDFKFKDGYLLHESNSLMSNFENNDISVIVQTCDEYEFLWQGWYLSFKNNWDWSLGWPIYFCTESKKPSFHDSRIKTVNTQKSKDSTGFSNRLTDILLKVKTKYVLYIQDDMWLRNKVDGNALKECLYLMKHFGWNSIKTHEKIWFNYKLEKTNYFVGEKRLLKYNRESEYLMTHNAAIWDRLFLLDAMAPDESPWKNETDATFRIRDKYDEPKIYHLDIGWYYPIGIQQGGKFLPFGDELNNQLAANEINKIIYSTQQMPTTY